MSDLRQAAQQVLEALRCVDLQSLVPDYGSGHYSVARLDGPQVKSAITAMEAALAEPVQAKPWVGLTEDERTDICDGYGANIHWRAFRAIEAKLQEKNT